MKIFILALGHAGYAGVVFIFPDFIEHEDPIFDNMIILPAKIRHRQTVLATCYARSNRSTEERVQFFNKLDRLIGDAIKINE